MNFTTLNTLEADFGHAIGDLIGSWVHQSMTLCSSISWDITIHMLRYSAIWAVITTSPLRLAYVLLTVEADK